MTRYHLPVLLLLAAFAFSCAGPSQGGGTAATPAADAPAGPTKKLVLLPLEAKGTDKGEVDTLTESLCMEAGKVAQFEVLCPSEVRALLEHSAEQRLLGCETADCIAKIGNLVAADVLLMGSIGKVDTTYTVNVRLMDPNGAKVLGRAARSADEKISGLLAELAPLIQEVARVANKK